jgi:hypothetical protein
MRLLLCVLAMLVFPTLAEARGRQITADPGCNVLWPCEGVAPSARGARIAREVGIGAAQQIYTPRVVEHPAGCPRRAFCGCGAAVRIFGAPVRALWLAANWFGFPRAAPAPGMAAVRSHHVFVLEQHLGGDTWLTYDANSGRHLTRVHARSIAGYTIVNPRV